jgi:hypothetical protein
VKHSAGYTLWLLNNRVHGVDHRPSRWKNIA